MYVCMYGYMHVCMYVCMTLFEDETNTVRHPICIQGSYQEQLPTKAQMIPYLHVWIKTLKTHTLFGGTCLSSLYMGVTSSPSRTLLDLQWNVAKSSFRVQRKSVVQLTIQASCS